ncbi:MAG: AsmA family protein [Candidatus Omnitrophota bacterium]|nr:AsmA family protein [Candidatus Omnitrophota bacterium]
MKKIIIIGLIIAFLFGAGIIYLNNILLPKTIKALIVKVIEEETNSKVSLGSLRVNIFKGLVLKDLNIYKGESALLKIKEASCLFFPWSLIEKKIAIPIINLESAQIFLERRKDNTFNLEDLFAPKPASNAPISGSAPRAKTSSVKKGFTVLIYRINLSSAKIVFQDSTFNKPFIKTLENVNLSAYLSLPASVKFRLSALLPGVQSSKISGSGEFKIPARELSAKLDILNFFPNEFSVYYAGSGLKINEGSTINISSDLKLKNKLFSADIQAQGENLNILREKVSCALNLDLRGVLEYNLNSNSLKYSGSSKIYNTVISGVEFVDKINIINCGIIFDNFGLSTENLAAQILGVPVEGKVVLNNFKDPEISLNAFSSLNLATLQGLLKDKFKFNFPGTIDGQGNLSLSVAGKLFKVDHLAVRGDLDLINAAVKLQKSDSPIRAINGIIVFSNGGPQKVPLLNISINSSDISLVSSLSFNDKLIKMDKCSGRYYLSEFSAAGTLGVTDPSLPEINLTGEVLIDLKSLAEIFPKLKDQLEKIKPDGKLKGNFNISGNINELKSCAIAVKASSDSISLYGLKGKDLILNYVQAGGIADIPALRFNLYGGSLEASFQVNLNSKNYAYWLDANMQDVKIEELKLDTQARAKDISGAIQGAVKVNGFLDDITGSQGKGRLSINKGKLWELDLFKGMGKLLFSQDFASITFSDGKCDFTIQDKSIFTGKLTLEGSMVNLSGPVKIGFDGSISATLNVDILSDLVPLTGTFKDVTTAIIGGTTGKFAEIRISGTLREPKYKFEAAVANIIKGLANTFLKRI